MAKSNNSGKGNSNNSQKSSGKKIQENFSKVPDYKHTPPPPKKK